MPYFLLPTTRDNKRYVVVNTKLQTKTVFDVNPNQPTNIAERTWNVDLSRVTAVVPVAHCVSRSAMHVVQHARLTFRVH